MIEDRILFYDIGVSKRPLGISEIRFDGEDFLGFESSKSWFGLHLRSSDAYIAMIRAPILEYEFNSYRIRSFYLYSATN